MDKKDPRNMYPIGTVFHGTSWIDATHGTLYKRYFIATGHINRKVIIAELVPYKRGYHYTEKSRLMDESGEDEKHNGHAIVRKDRSLIWGHIRLDEYLY